MSAVFPWMDPWLLQEQSLHLEPWLGIDVELFRELFLSATLSQICFHLDQDYGLSPNPEYTTGINIPHSRFYLGNVCCWHMVIVPGWDGRCGRLANGEHMVGVGRGQHVTANAEVETATGAVAGHPTTGLDTVTGHTLTQLHSLLQIIARDAGHAPRLLVPTQPLVNAGVLGVHLLKYHNLVFSLPQVSNINKILSLMCVLCTVLVKVKDLQWKYY